MTNLILYTEPASHTIALVAITPRLYTLEAAAHHTGIHSDMLRHYCSLGLVDSEMKLVEGEPMFDDEALYRLRRIEHYRRHHGVNLQALPLLCALERKVDRLERELRFLRGP